MSDRHLRKMAHLGIYDELGETSQRSIGRIRNDAHVEELRTGIRRALVADPILVDENTPTKPKNAPPFQKKTDSDRIKIRTDLILEMEGMIREFFKKKSEDLNEMAVEIFRRTAQSKLKETSGESAQTLQRTLNIFRKKSESLPQRIFSSERAEWTEKLILETCRYIIWELKEYRDLLNRKRNANELVAPWNDSFLLDQLECIESLSEMENGDEKNFVVQSYITICMQKVLKQNAIFSPLYSD